MIGTVVTPDRLRELLMSPEEAAELDAPGSTDAAVLVPLYLDGDELGAVFTERRADMKIKIIRPNEPGPRPPAHDTRSRRRPPR